MGLFKRMFGREEEVEPIFGGLSEPSGLERLAALPQRGALSDAEFAAAKAQLLGGS